ncbi:MAG: dTDP-4-dehydrorhamnose reductase [Candidatus Eisenbacteria bacterium]|uniref:dTDP-4-dehydrorhamnose reductase n=1 Tax=Eiseniibacteriota bacterium TaxID=2212470 RepID=A0A937XAT6_UNCEI|nr:dTDP-4-dehydrorhamnose reductase [Candidatus Eisenbacteria bacterium]
MRILVTGAGGQLGEALRRVLEPRHAVVWTDREELDVRDLEAMRDCARAERPEAILHLAAVTQVDACESAPQMTFEVNALGARYAALAARECGARLLFTSTDYVFDGEQERPYAEYDTPRPLNVYGWSKLHGERAIEALTERHFIVRTSGLFGAGRPCFPEAILRAAAERGSVRVVGDQVCRPTFVAHLAEAIGALIETEDYGRYHVASAGATSWHAFAREILDAAGMRRVRAEAITSAELARPAARPARSVLDTRAYELTRGRALPHRRDGLAEFLAQRRS